jgi:hypothetical protein
MPNRPIAVSPIAAWITAQYPFLIGNYFRPLLLLAVYDTDVLPLAECAAMILIVLIAAPILCIICGNYFYKFPGEMRI